MTTNLFFGVEAGLLPKTISFSMISCWRLCFENEIAKWSKIQDFCWMIECLGGEMKKNAFQDKGLWVTETSPFPIFPVPSEH